MLLCWPCPGPTSNRRLVGLKEPCPGKKYPSSRISSTAFHCCLRWLPNEIGFIKVEAFLPKWFVCDFPWKMCLELKTMYVRDVFEVETIRSITCEHCVQRILRVPDSKWLLERQGWGAFGQTVLWWNRVARVSTRRPDPSNQYKSMFLLVSTFQGRSSKRVKKGRHDLACHRFPTKFLYSEC